MNFRSRNIILAGFVSILLLLVTSCRDSGPAQVSEIAKPEEPTRLLPLISSAGGVEWKIALPDDPSEAEVFAAAELARLLEKCMGVELPIVGESEIADGKPAFYVGLTSLAAEIFTDSEFPDGDAFRIRGTSDAITLVGGNDRSTLYAVYGFAERFLGAVWPNRDQEILEQRAELSLPGMDILEVPSFARRQIMQEFWSDWSESDFNEREALFRLRNRDNRFFRLGEARFGWFEEDAPFENGVHNIPTYMEAPEVLYSMNRAEGFKHLDELLAEMPDDVFARSETGKILRAQGNGHLGQVNLMHPDVRAIVHKNLLERIALYQKTYPPREPQDGRPAPTVFDLSLNDNAAVSHDPATRAFVEKHGSEAAPLIDFINEMADAVAAEHPEIQLRTLAYMQSQKPPTSDLRPRENVIIRWCDWTMGGTPQPNPEPWHPLTHENNTWRAENIRAWGQISDAMEVWDYGERYAGATFPIVLAPNLQPDLRLFQEAGVTGLMIQNTESAPWEHAQFSNYYVWLALQLMWDVDADEPVLREKFLRASYGAGAEAMGAAYAELAAVGKELPRRADVGTNILLIEPITPQLYQTLNSHFATAAGAVAEGSPESFNILQERLTLSRSLLNNWGNLERKLEPGQNMGFDREAQIRFFAAGSGQLLQFLRYSPEKTKAFRKTVATDVERWQNPPNTPERFANIPADAIQQFYWPDFVTYRTEIVEDADGAGGKAMRLKATDAEAHAHPVRFGLYNKQTEQYGPSRTIQRQELPTEGTFGLYRIGIWEIRPGAQLFGHQSWVVGADLTPAFFPSEDPAVNTWEVWVSAKFAGPAYYPGSSEGNQFTMDRVVLVRPQE